MTWNVRWTSDIGLAPRLPFDVRTRQILTEYRRELVMDEHD